jgi:hypothetical protein
VPPENLKAAFQNSKRFQEVVANPPSKIDVIALTAEIVDELYGEIRRTDFTSISEIAPWMAHRNNLVRRLLGE